MAYDRFMIAPPDGGLQTDLRPWLIPDQAFARLKNAYVFRGRVRKRFGSYLMNNTDDPKLSRFRINIATTDAGGNAAGVVPGVIWKIGQAFSVGDELFTVWQANGVMLTTGTGAGTYNTATGAYTIAGADPLTIVYFYPAEPVMGLLTYEVGSINDEFIIGFDTQFAYEYNTATGWTRLGTAIWTGNNSQFYWGYTIPGIAANDNIFMVANYNPPDTLKYWDGVVWTNFTPVILASGDFVQNARIVVQFHGRTLFINTIENIGGGNEIFLNRCRYSQRGSPLQVDAFREDIGGKGNFLDAYTQEAAITAEFIKDRLIVYFERSTWELVYLGNEIEPFRWQQINTELGVESTFSIVPFDKVAIGVGNVGVHACNGANVERIDDKIPDTVFEIHNENAGVERVYGIRDYYVEMVYWTFPAINATSDQPFPKRVLVYNYKNGTWSFNDDSITVFGYYQNITNLTWATATFLWQEGSETWSAGPLQTQFRQVIAGNQEGFTFIVFPDIARNAPALQITNIVVVGNTATVTIIDHNLQAGGDADYIIFENIATTINTLNITNLNGNIYPVASIIDKDTFTIINNDPTNPINGVYDGGGTVARISRIDILTKQYNFYAKQGRNAYIQKVDFMVDKTSDGSITVDCFASSSTQSLLADGLATGTVMGSNVLETFPFLLYPLEFTQSRLWHPVFLQADGEVVQLRIFLSDTQMINPEVVWSDFEMHAMLFYATPTAGRLQ